MRMRACAQSSTVLARELRMRSATLLEGLGGDSCSGEDMIREAQEVTRPRPSRRDLPQYHSVFKPHCDFDPVTAFFGQLCPLFTPKNGTEIAHRGSNPGPWVHLACANVPHPQQVERTTARRLGCQKVEAGTRLSSVNLKGKLSPFKFTRDFHASLLSSQKGSRGSLLPLHTAWRSGLLASPCRARVRRARRMPWRSTGRMRATTMTTRTARKRSTKRLFRVWQCDG